ncbi:MAG: hypothetical protein KGJ78_00295 [Alphaproteobacteria bacterium]|nr:hypothetical protein [Alphaproteobacteria bacterium]
MIGSFERRRIPDGLRAMVKDGVPVDPRNGTPMEMDAYSVYMALKALEIAYGVDFAAEKEVLAQSVVRRMTAPAWSHGAWTGSPHEIHMRFIAAGIRLMVEAHGDGLLRDAGVILRAVERLLAYSEPLERGRWYLHDSLEMPKIELPHPHKRLPNRAWGSSEANCLVLNTHLDTLSTVIHVLRRIPLSTEIKYSLILRVEEGLAALELVLSHNESPLWRRFSRVDVEVRKRLFHTYGHRPQWSLGARLLRRGIRDGYFPVRQHIRSAAPGFVHPDGYLERDISLRGRGFEYHVVNAFDLIRLVLEAEAELILSSSLKARCEALVDAAINHAIDSPYANYLYASMRDSTRPILLCETILARLGSMPDPSLPQRWIRAYCRIRQRLPPSAAILGYDPFIVGRCGSPSRKLYDIVTLRNGRILEIDLTSGTAVILPRAHVERFPMKVPARL